MTKYIFALIAWICTPQIVAAQGTLPENFWDGKAIVLVSAAPDARPILDWQDISKEIHSSLLDAGGDPVAYYELEDIILSEEIQAGYANVFNRRQIKNIIILSRTSNGQIHLNIGSYTKDKNILSPGNIWSTSAPTVKEVGERVKAAGTNHKSQNLLAIDVPEFLSASGPGGLSGETNRFIARNPLNLETFKLGIPLSGVAGESALLTSFRYDLLGKSAAAIEAEQQAERAGVEAVVKNFYPHQVEYLTSFKSDQELIGERVQFVLVKVEGREADLMESMGLNSSDLADKNRIVIKYYIRFLVRNELYVGPKWDADPNWRVALTNFLQNLQIDTR
ncbi:NTPase [Pararhodonellum marinum]|uniref:NTPase n=1 Tax=Pararhodonellum marinum TaxID=2755358 RepID=UPI001890428E|nr:NTPase [Pararhodonellum marinum]